MVIAYAAFVLATQPRVGSGSLVGSLVVAASIGLGLSAWYLLPIADGLDVFERGEGLSRALAARDAHSTDDDRHY